MKSTRGKILRVSRDLFRKKGYFGTGIQQIIQESGIPRGSLYYHFPMGKESLAIEVLQEASLEKAEEYKAAVYRQNPDQALRNIVQIFIDDLIASNYKYACPILSLSLSSGDEMSPIQQAAADAFHYWEAQLVLFYKKRKIEDAEEKVSLFLSALDGAFAVSKIYRNTDRLEAIKKNTHLFI